MSRSEQEWAQDKRKELPERPGGRGKTTGIYRDKHGKEHQLISEYDDQSPEINRYLSDSAAFPYFRGSIDVSSHVETRLAWKMRRDKQRHTSVVINNELCDRKVSSMFAHLGCRRAVRAILPKGYTLDVWEEGATEPTTIRGVADQ
ncbi:DddA-like double-stranded DNA deaminase toxin [Actinopolyspora sp. H202]|uniref:DddA-like double-stranded DNA deaminase toxin n=1 Tax=Actinopolyspora sp. H202 TaxID=1500456 RepID=UPI003EE54A38